MQVALLSVPSPHGVCRVMLQGVANTGIVQASGKGSRGSNSNCWGSNSALSSICWCRQNYLCPECQCKRFVLWGVVKIQPVYKPLWDPERGRCCRSVRIIYTMLAGCALQKWHQPLRINHAKLPWNYRRAGDIYRTISLRTARVTLVGGMM